MLDGGLISVDEFYKLTTINRETFSGSYGEMLMKNRKRQRQNRRRYTSAPRSTPSGCMDMTSYLAIRKTWHVRRNRSRHGKIHGKRG